jgi:hypothetical protein
LDLVSGGVAADVKADFEFVSLESLEESLESEESFDSAADPVLPGISVETEGALGNCGAGLLPVVCGEGACPLDVGEGVFPLDVFGAGVLPLDVGEGVLPLDVCGAGLLPVVCGEGAFPVEV